MNTAVVVNTGIAVMALAVSASLAVRQLLTARRANYLAVSLQLLRETTTVKFLEDEEYILRALSNDCQVDRGLSGLPVDVRTRVWQVAYLYQTIGYLAALRAIDRRMVRYLVGVRAVNVWRSIAPFVAAERRLNADGVGFRFFEDLATRCADLSSSKTVKQFHLRNFPDPVTEMSAPSAASDTSKPDSEARSASSDTPS